MDEKTTTALKESIAHWERVVESEYELTGREHCALCRAFNSDVYVKGCAGCPVYENTGVKYCEASPYLEYEEFLENDSVMDFDSVEDYEARRRELAQAELDFLRSLLPVERDDACPHGGECAHDGWGDPNCDNCPCG